MLCDYYLGTVWLMPSLTSLCKSKLKHQKAKPLHKECPEKRTASLDNDHLDTQSVMSNLAVLHQRQ